MKEEDIGAIPVVKKEEIIGILTERDFFKIIA
jgi:CBS domain-containing protein